MERKIGETFEYEGKKIEVKAASRACDGCFLEEKCCIDLAVLLGTCGAGDRTDKKDVIFVEVQKQPHEEDEVVKERKVGEVFEYEGHKLKVVADTDGRKCPKCFFYSRDCSLIRDVTGYCLKEKRIDRKGVTFVEAKDEQPQQAEQPKLNLCVILKNCPEGTELWSDNYGIVKFVNVGTEWDTPIRVKLTNGSIARYTEEGWCDKRFPANCLLWPSRDCRDWSKFTAPWLKKERFDPKTLKAFDRVLVKDSESLTWKINMFSHINNKAEYPYCCLLSFYKYCIPYNDETKHLVETRDEAPEYYRYWED